MTKKDMTEHEKPLDPLSMTVKAKKEQWYSKVKLSVKQLDVIIYIAGGLLAVVVLLMILEAAGLFKLPL